MSRIMYECVLNTPARMIWSAMKSCFMVVTRLSIVTALVSHIDYMYVHLFSYVLKRCVDPFYWSLGMRLLRDFNVCA